MKWYKRYPADFVVKTLHLSLAERGAYSALLDRYYAEGEPLPADVDELVRIVNARGVAERRAVERVAAEFFPVNGDGTRHNKRADEEIDKAAAVSQKRSEAAKVRYT